MNKLKILLFRGIGGFTVSRKTLDCLGIDTQSGLEIEKDELGMYFLFVQDFYPKKFKEISDIEDENEFFKELDKLRIKMRGDEKLISCWRKLGEEFPDHKDDYEDYKLIEIPDNIEGLRIEESETGYEYAVDTNRKW